MRELYGRYYGMLNPSDDGIIGVKESHLYSLQYMVQHRSKGNTRTMRYPLWDMFYPRFCLLLV